MDGAETQWRLIPDQEGTHEQQPGIHPGRHLQNENPQRHDSIPVNACRAVRECKVARGMMPRRLSSTRRCMLASARTAAGVKPVQLAQLMVLSSVSPAKQCSAEGAEVVQVQG